MQYNFTVAFAFTLVVCACVAALGAHDLLPITEMESQPGFSRNPAAPYCTLLAPITFFVVMHFASDVPLMLPRGWSMAPTVFLDKMCIHQTNSRLKEEGILHLDKFAAKSHSFVILQSEEYLERLWTVHELGTVLLIHKSPNIIILPLNIAPFLFACSAVHTISELCKWTVRTTWAAKLGVSATLMINLPPCVHTMVVIAFVLFFRRSEKEQERRRRQLRTFSISFAKCGQEEDRASVQNNIFAMMKAIGVVNETDGMEVALNSFDCIVRAELPRAMASSMGHRGFPLRYGVIVSVTLIGAAFDFLASDLAAGETPRFAAPRCLFWLFWAFPGISLLCLCVSLMTSRCLHLTGVCEGSYLVLVSFSALVFGYFTNDASRRLREQAETSDTALILYILLTLVQVGVVCVFLCPSQHIQRLSERHWRGRRMTAPTECTSAEESRISSGVSGESTQTQSSTPRAEGSEPLTDLPTELVVSALPHIGEPGSSEMAVAVSPGAPFRCASAEDGDLVTVVQQEFSMAEGRAFFPRTCDGRMGVEAGELTLARSTCDAAPPVAIAEGGDPTATPNELRRVESCTAVRSAGGKRVRL